MVITVKIKYLLNMSMKCRILCDVAFEILRCCNNLYIEKHLFFVSLHSLLIP